MRFRNISNSLVISGALSVLFSVSVQAATQFLPGHVPDAITASKASGRVPQATQLRLAVGLPLRNQDELESLLKQLVDPASPEYRHYLTPDQFAARFSPSAEDYQALADFFQANGFAITETHPNRTILDVSGTAAQIETVLHVNMLYWTHPVRGTFFAPDRDPSIDAGVTILHISGLDNFVLPRPMDLKSRSLTDAQPFTTGSGPAGLFIGNDYRAAYAPGVTLNGAGQAVGLFELDGFYAADVQSNFKQAGLPAVPVQTVLLDGFNGSPGSSNVEVILDIMMASYMAPGVSKVIVYEGTNPDDVLNRMATDNLASQLSSSWGWSPLDAIVDQIFKQMIAQGQSLFQASGDDGAYHGGVMPPADDPNITVVGGTSLTTAGKGGTWQSESAWSDSGGGVSTTWPIPSYQQSVNMAAVGGSSTMRNIPDVSLLADIQIFLVCNNGQQIMVGGTSAAAPLWAGFLALANQQALAGKKPTVGFVNPAIYAIGAGSSYQADLHDIISGNNGFSTAPGFDLATGWGTPTGQALINSLTATSATPGFGLSSSASTLSIAPGASGVSTITIGAQQGFSGAVNLTISGLPTGVTASFSPASASTTSTLTVVASNSAVASTSALTITGTSGSLTNTAHLSLTITAPPAFTLSAPPPLSLKQGSSTPATISVSPQAGFNGTVTFSLTGLPTGVTGSFNPSSSTKATTLTLSAAANAAPGTATVTVTGTSGAVTNKVTFAVTVTAAADFTLSAAPASLTILSGATGTSSLTVNAQTGFASAVAFSASGLPSGVSATFAPVSATRTSVVTFVASSAAAAGSATVTITGTSGALTSQTPIALTITRPPSFTLSAAPAALTIAQGASGISTLTLTPLNGFSSPVLISVSGLPGGVVPTFTAGPNSATATLTFAASATAAAGTSTVTVTGKAGTLTQTVSIALTIQASSAASGTVSLSSAYNVTGMVTDGATFLSSSGLDGGGRAYSGSLLATVRTAGGLPYNFGPSNAPGAVTGGTIALPSGQFSLLTVLGTAVNGSQIGQKFVVTYTDGTTSTFTQSLSDWCMPQNFTGELNAIAMPYRDNSNGTRDTRTVMLYAYTFSLTSSKTVKSIALPGNRNVVVLAMNLSPASGTSTTHAFEATTFRLIP